jgi:hypothetical protein
MSLHIKVRLSMKILEAWEEKASSQEGGEEAYWLWFLSHSQGFNVSLNMTSTKTFIYILAIIHWIALL